MSGQPMVLPTAEYFPGTFRQSPEGIRELLDVVCGYMDVRPTVVSLEIVSHEEELWFVNSDGKYLPKAAGTYQENGQMYHITLDRDESVDPFSVVGTLAHELAHARLLGEQHISGDEYDHELLTDLTAVFLGFGVFLANQPRNWDSQYSLWPGTDLRKPEYMTLPLFGYTLAHIAWHCSEDQPAWARYLNWSAKPSFKQGLKYLRRTANSRFKPIR